MSIHPSGLSTSSLTGSTSDPSVDDITRLFRRLADRGDGKGGVPDGVVSDAEARTYARQAEAAMGPHIKTTTDGTLTPHEQIGALEWEMRKIAGKDPARLARLQQAVSDLMCGMVNYAPTPHPDDAPGRAVAQYGNIRFVAQNPGDAQAAQDYVRDFFKTASATNSGRYLIESLVKQDNGKPIIIQLKDSKLGESVCGGHNSIEHYYTADQGNDAHTVLIHEMSHAAGKNWDGDIVSVKTYAALYPTDTNKNNINDIDELQAVIETKWDDDHNPLKNPYTKGRYPNLTFDTVDEFYNNTRGAAGGSFTEHAAVFFEQAFRQERGLPLYRTVYKLPEMQFDPLDPSKRSQRTSDPRGFNPNDH